jgi:hypothetical protein
MESTVIAEFCHGLACTWPVKICSKKRRLLPRKVFKRNYFNYLVGN